MIIVRSQDRADLLEVGRVSIGNDVTCEANAVVGITQWGSKVVLGEYKSKDRALRIVDMIQNQIETEVSSDVVFRGTRKVRNSVFLMPRE